MHLFYHPDPTGSLVLDRDDSRHAVKVLRLQQGDRIEIADGQGTWFEATITRADPQQCAFTIADRKSEPLRNFRIHIALAPTKNSDRTEWFIEKAVETGIDEISFIHCRNSERKAINLERAEKIAISAMKQSRRARIPVLNPIRPMDHILKTIGTDNFIAFVDSNEPVHLKAAARPQSKSLVLIGPEGDFTRDELNKALDAGFRKVSLGPHRLRTETAALSACFILNLINT